MRTVERTWGNYQVIHEHEGNVVKILTIGPSRALSLQRHSKRKECWTVISGCGLVSANLETADDGDLRMYSEISKVGASVVFNVNDWHTISNISNTENLVILEVQTGDCDETDIERFVP